jgi:transaldolase/glucose-6-phosphate isomerase
MNAIEKLHQLGQSIWYDNIERKLLKNGEMEHMITLGEIRGVTSNPSIFQNAIANSTDYDSAIQPMSWANWNSEEIFFQLAIEDIQETADLFLPLYNQTKGKDGFVSLEVNPKLAYDAEKTFTQALALWKRVNRKNLMIKIPATQEGLVAIKNAIGAGININVTLIFSIKRYHEVIEAYLSGLEDRLTKNLPIDKIASVASFFVSRVDSKIDSHLDTLLKNNKIDQQIYLDLRGKAAIANSKLAYELFENIIASKRFLGLAENGANVQRPLWASTSTKNPEYYDVIYVEELIGKYSVNTMPPQTLDAFRDHGKAEIKIKNKLAEAKDLFTTLSDLGIDIDFITQTLEDEGVKAFAKAFDSLLETIEKRKKIINEQLVNLGEEVRNCIEILDSSHVVNRIYEKDPSIWTKDTQSGELIQNRLGWLDAPFLAKTLIPEINQFRDEVINEGFTHAVLLGMGGSSLSAEVMSL